MTFCFVFRVFLEFAKRQLEEGQSEKEVELGRQLSEYNNDFLFCVPGVLRVC